MKTRRPISDNQIEELKSIDGMSEAQARTFVALVDGTITPLEAGKRTAALNALYKFRVQTRLTILGHLARAKNPSPIVADHLARLQIALAGDALQGLPPPAEN